MSEQATVQPPSDRYCDLVMKGGITSGVVYPRAICRLARHYRFRSIGGTSAGAIAAAATAAAEYQRRASGSDAGFARLARLPDELGADSARPGASSLLSLFQPQPGTHRLFSVLVRALNSSSTERRVFAIVIGLLSAYWPATIGSLLLGVLVWRWQGWLAGVLMALTAALAWIGAWVYRDITRRLVDNGFGMCTGMTAPGSSAAALTPWLHELVQAAAGRKAEDAPLTFGDLWDAPGFPPPWLGLPAGAKPRSIDLQMFATNLAHGRPYIFPLAEPAPMPSELRPQERLFFKAEELERYLPAPVMQWLRDHARPEQGSDPSSAAAASLGLLELPQARDFPVLLAARMSLSLPLLFSAVPLWAIDHDVPVAQLAFHRCWFSDGGISSNFPMHLFDGLVAMWPTFGISLDPKIPGSDQMVFVPRNYAEGYGERWSRFDAKPRSASRFGGFLAAIVGTMQNWNDNALSRMPGVRDRIARVRLHPHEGGMNLNMERQIIEAVAQRGAQAGEDLLARFGAAASDATQGDGWDEHRLVRLNVLLKMMEARATGVVTALEGQCAHATDFETLIERAQQQAAAGYDKPLNSAQAAALHKVVAALGAYMRELAAANRANPFIAVPRPELRVRPPL